MLLISNFQWPLPLSSTIDLSNVRLVVSCVRDYHHISSDLLITLADVSELGSNLVSDLPEMHAF
jgi:hypothetical protein